MESNCGDPNRNNPIINALPFISNPYIAKHLGLKPQRLSKSVLKGAALQSLQN